MTKIYGNLRIAWGKRADRWAFVARVGKRLFIWGN